MNLKDKIKLLEENYSDLEMDNIMLMRELKKKQDEIDRLAKIIYLYGHTSIAAVLADKEIIDKMYEHPELYRGKDIDLDSFDLMLQRNG